MCVLVLVCECVFECLCVSVCVWVCLSVCVFACVPVHTCAGLKGRKRIDLTVIDQWVHHESPKHLFFMIIFR